MNLTNLQPTTPACHSTVDFHMISVITTMMPTDKSEIYYHKAIRLSEIKITNVEEAVCRLPLCDRGSLYLPNKIFLYRSNS